MESLSRGKSPIPEALILELRGQILTTEVVDAIRSLKIPTILLAGNAELHDSPIAQHRWDIVLKRPFSLGNVADLIEKLVPLHGTSRT
jgi:hypothetical protein